MDKIELENNKERYLRKVPIPPGWNVYTLYETRDKSEKYSFTGGPFGSHLKKEHYTEKGVRIIQLQNIGDGKFLDNYKLYTSEEKADELYSCNIFPHDIIISKMAEPLARACKVPAIEERFLMASDGIRLKVDKDRFDTDFILYTINSWYFRKEAIRKGTGTTRMRIGLSDLKNIRLMAPNLHEQKLVSDILLTWDKAIELKEKLIEQKKEQKKGLMQKLLTGEVRLPGFDGEWEEVKLEQVVDRVKGKVIKYSEDGLYPAIDMEYLESGIFRNYTNDDSVLANKNDVLLLWDGSRAGRAFTGMKGSVGSTFVKLTCKRINNIFLQKHLELNEKRIQRLREGSGIPHIPKDFLSIYKIKVPKKQEQEAIAEILLKMDEKIILLRKEAELLKQQKKGLMQLLLTGKVRVKV